MSKSDAAPVNHFIRQRIREDIKAGKNDGKVVTRFPPEPNGYLHIGHAKAICLNFGMAQEFAGDCNLRFDDTNPLKESVEYIEAIKQDVSWLGFEWSGEVRFASDYFDRLYEYALFLIKQGRAYVCSLNNEQIREYRGTLKQPGKNSPHRERSVAENLELFEKMRQGEFADGEHVLRAKIDMASPNMNMRDPIIYRIRHVAHHQTGDKWCIYPMYDFTHCLSDAIEGVTHSLCSLEFEDHRPLYDWCLQACETEARPQQTEFARLSLEHTITSKRKLNQLVEEGTVDGWDDPRMPTIAGMRRRGFTPDSLRDFCERVGVTRVENTTVEMSLLESCVRQDLEHSAPRAMGVLRPLKVVIDNWPEDKEVTLSAPRHPQHEEWGERELPFTRELWIDRNDFMEVAPNKKFKRLVSGGEVRLRNAWVIKCEEVIKDDEGTITELRCTYDPDTLGKNPEGRKVKGVIHWVSGKYGVPAEVRVYDRLFTVPNPDGDKEKPFTDFVNPESLVVHKDCVVEPSLAQAQASDRFQFEREGYFCVDSHEPQQSGGKMVFNRVVALRDSWAKIAKKGG